MNLPNKEKYAVFTVRVKANSKKNQILAWNEEITTLEVAIAAPADKNKANTALVKFLSKELKNQVRIKSGLTSKEKKFVFV